MAPTITSTGTVSNVEDTVLAHALTANESVTWIIVGGADAAEFEIIGSTLRWLGNGVKAFISGTPTIQLSASSILESALSGSTVGVLSVSDGTGVYTFTKTADPDAKFAVSGSNLNTSAALDYETATSHSVTIQASNGVDAAISRTFTISVTDVVEGGTLPTPTLTKTSAAGAPLKFSIGGLIPDDVVGFDWYIEVGGGTEAIPDFADGPGAEVTPRTLRRQIIYADFTGALAFTVMDALPSGVVNVRLRIMADDGRVGTFSNVVGADIGAVGTINDRLITEGDSLTSAGPNGYNYLYDAAYPAVDYNKLAVGGSTIGVTSATSPSLLNRQATALALKAEVMTVLIGTNDVGNTTRYPTVQNWYDALVAYIAPFRASGTLVAVGTITPKPDGAFNTRRNAANVLIRAGSGVDFEAVFDFAADPTIGTDTAGSNTTFYPDGVHPSQDVHATYLHPIYRPVANFLLGFANEVTGLSFTDATDVVASAVSTSNTLTPGGLYTGETKSISVTGGEYRLNGGLWVSTAGTFTAGDTVAVRGTASATASDTVNVALTIGTVSDTYLITTAAPVSYTAQSVTFDGADRLARGAALTGVVAGKAGMFSGWVKFAAGGSSQQFIVGRSISSGLRVERSSSGRITVDGRNSGESAILQIRTNTTGFITSTAWHHILASWDLATGRAQLYIDGVTDVDGAFTVTINDTIAYNTPDYGVGASTLATNFLIGDMADPYLNTVTSLDLSVLANRQKFNIADTPVDLGADGSTPTGSAPAVFLSGAVASWHTNKGAGGGFTLTGALAAGATNP